MKTGLPRGTRSIARAAELLRVLGNRRTMGWRLTDLASQCNLDDSTAQRIMSCLVALRLAQQREKDRRYAPGPMLFELALSLPDHFAFQNACHKNVERLAKDTGCTTFLFLRSGNDSVCIDRCGKSSIQLIVDVGTRRPLAGSATGIAMLLALPPPEQRAIRQANKKELMSVTSHRHISYDAMWKRSKLGGVGMIEEDILPGMGSLGVAILDASKRPFAAIGFSGSMDEVFEDRTRKIALLRAEARKIEREQFPLINH